jgi:HPt (histidine-containing phosphotransfer) domain-containing protein
MTANALEGDKDRCLAAGMDAYLSKPISRAKLASAIGQPPKESPKPVAEKPTAIRAYSRLDRSRLRLVCEGDEQFANDLIRSFLADTLTRMDEMEEALGAESTELLLRLAHTMKGAALNVGANRLAATSQLLRDAIASEQNTPELRMIVNQVRREIELFRAETSQGRLL